MTDTPKPNWWNLGSWREQEEEKKRLQAENTAKVFKPDENIPRVNDVEYKAYQRMRARRVEDCLSTSFNPACLGKHDRTAYDIWLCENCDRYTIKAILSREKKAKKPTPQRPKKGSPLAGPGRPTDKRLGNEFDRAKQDYKPKRRK